MSFPRKKIQKLIEKALRNKINNFNPESGSKPIHDRLLGQDRMNLFSIIHSINTTIGASIYEPVAKQIAKSHFEKVDIQVGLSGKFTTGAQEEISAIVRELSLKSVTPNHASELKRIRSKCKSGGTLTKKMTVVDLHIMDGNNYFLIDIKTAKPNIGATQNFKQTALEWMATKLFENPKANVRPVIGIPYNPYHPEPYDRWTMKDYFEISEQGQLLVGREFWNFISGGEDIYDQLLECFEVVGKKMRREIDRFVAKNQETHPHRDVFN